MSSNSQKSVFTTRFDGAHGVPFGPLVLLAFGLPLGGWWFLSQVHGGGSEFATFDAMTAVLIVLAMAFLGLHGLRNMAWTSVPVLFTFEALAGFVAVPAWQFATGADTLDGSYNLAIFELLVGLAAFWSASAALTKESGLKFAPSAADTSSRVLLSSIALLVLGVLGNVALWRFGLFGYAGDDASRASYAGILAWIAFIANLMGYSLVVSGIEVFGKRTTEPAIKLVFWLSFLLNMGFSFISGMKSSMMTPIFMVILIYGVTRRRLPRMAVILPVFLIMVVYPFASAYRDNLNSGFRDQSNTLGGMEQTLVKSFNDAFFSFGATSQGTLKENLQASTSRVSYLDDLRDVCSLPSPSMLQNDEKLWMAPVYAIVPRFFWKSKPLIAKGGILSVLLGRPASTASALTPIGDLFSAYGTWGVVIGMLVWGAFVQLCMNWVGNKPATERMLFAYVIMLKPLLDLENDFTAMIAGAFQTAIVVAVTSYLIYGRTTSAAEETYSQRTSPQN